MALLDQLFLDTLRGLQWLSADKTHAYQARLAERLARHAATQTRHYQTKLSPLFAGGDSADGAFRFEAWSELPILSRTEAAASGTALDAKTMPTVASASVKRFSTGASGTLFRFNVSALAMVASTCARNRMWETHDVDLFGRGAEIAVTERPDAVAPFGVKATPWNMTGRLASGRLIDRSTPVGELWDWLHRINPNCLQATPDILEGIADTSESESTFDQFDAILSCGGNVSSLLRERLTRRLARRVIDSYALSETGVLACECPLGGYHAQSDIAIVEVLDAEGQQVGPGERGRIVATPLYQYGTPLLRYDTGDEAIVGEPCSCGRSSLKIAKIFGRDRRLFRLEGGVCIAGSRLAAVAETLDARRIRLVQRSGRALEIHYERGPSDKQDEALQQVQKRYAAYGVEVAINKAPISLQNPGDATSAVTANAARKLYPRALQRMGAPQ